jgi:hypothetical protein
MSLNTILATAPLTTTNYILKATGTTIGNSLIWDNGTNVGIGNQNSLYTLDVSGTGRFTGIVTFGSTLSNGTYAYTLPSATGTLALTSAIPANPVGGTGTTNTIPKFTASSTIGDSAITDDGTTVTLVSRALSGTTATFSGNTTVSSASSSGFVVNSTNNASYRGFTIQANGTTQAGFEVLPNTGEIRIGGYSTTNDYFPVIYSDGVAALTFGIGATPSATFSSSVTANGLYASTGNSARFYRSANDYYWSIHNDGNNYLNFGTYLANGTAYLTNPKMILWDNGSVGIGTSSPSTKLQIEDGYISTYHNINANGAGYGIQFYTNGGGSKNTIASIDISQVGTTRSGDMIFNTSNAGAPTERMRITSGGRVLINTTSTTSAGLGTGLFQVNSEVMSVGGYSGLFWENRSGGVTATSNWYGWYTIGGTIYLYNGANNVANIAPSTGVYTATSDINKKKDFEPYINNGLNAILGLKPTLYRMKSEDESTDKHLGLIAQEVKDYIPQAYVETIAEEKDGGVHIGLNYNAITATLVKAIQEMNTKIIELEKIVATK